MLKIISRNTYELFCSVGISSFLTATKRTKAFVEACNTTFYVVRQYRMDATHLKYQVGSMDILYLRIHEWFWF